MILTPAVMYTIGLGISGVGMAMALIFGYLTSGDPMILVGIMFTFSVAQYIESYVLEPFVVGNKIDLHPFFVILIVIVGNMVWMIIAMVLALPLLGIVNAIVRHIPVLKPFGYLLSKEK